MLDTESHVIVPGLLAPPGVCMSFMMEWRPTKHPDAWTDSLTYVPGCTDVEVVNFTEAVDLAKAVLSDKTVHIVGHNIAYDLAVLCAKDASLIPLVFAALEDQRISCTRVREKLIRLAQGRMASDFASGAKRQAKFNMATIFKVRWNLDISESKAELTFDDDGTPIVQGDVTAWRLRFAELENIPIAQWPPKAVEYAAGDITKTHKMFWAQAEDTEVVCYDDDGNPVTVVDPDTGFVTNEFEAVAAAFALQLAGCWGVRTDGNAVYALAERLKGAVERVKKALSDPSIGIYRLKDGSQDMAVLKKIITDAYGGNPPLVKTKKKGDVREECECEKPVWGRSGCKTCGGKKPPGVSTEKDVLVASPPAFQPTVIYLKEVKGVMELVEEPVLHALASISAAKHNYDNYIPAMSHGVLFPINAGWNELVDTGRTSCWGPNWQNMPREGGFRECVIPREGWLFIEADYHTLELCALAEVCEVLFGYSAMAVALREGKDLHLLMATDIINSFEGRALTYEQVEEVYLTKVDKYGVTFKLVKSMRQMAKALNFGFPGGLGPESLITYARKSYKVTFGATHEEAMKKARDLKELWLRRWPEMREYFKYISQKTAEGGGECAFIQLVTGRIRGGTGYCDGCNTFFQGLAADGAKAALFYCQMECFTGYSPFWTKKEHGDEKSPLFGSRITIFVHDELLGESPRDRAPQAAERMSQVMSLAMSYYIRRVPVHAGPVVMGRWYKDAETVRDADGNLIEWKPAEAA
jgi:hypothetical protein